MFNPYFHTVPLFDFSAKYPVLNGTGVFIAVDDQRFVVTAAHVVEKSAEKIAFGYEHYDEAAGKKFLELEGHEKLPVCKSQAATNEGDPQLVTYVDGLDLALIGLPPYFREWLEKRYKPFDMRQNNPNPSVGLIDVCGWPERKNRFNPYKNRFDSDEHCIHLGSQAMPKELTRTMGGDPETHFAIRMNKKKDFFSIITLQHYTIFKLYGMSGCGVWDCAMSGPGDREFPTKATALAGIFVEDHRTKNLAMAVRVEFIWHMLFKCCGIVR